MFMKMVQKRRTMLLKHFTFKRFAYVNLVTGHVDYRQWTSNDRTFDSVLTPTIKGYTADKKYDPCCNRG